MSFWILNTLEIIGVVEGYYSANKPSHPHKSAAVTPSQSLALRPTRASNNLSPGRGRRKRAAHIMRTAGLRIFSLRFDRAPLSSADVIESLINEGKEESYKHIFYVNQDVKISYLFPFLNK
jgi:hypothetical protein